MAKLSGKQSAIGGATPTPRQLGYRFPAEWEPHAATWLSWPRPAGVSFPGRYHTIVGELARIVREIAARERVEINVPNENWEHEVRRQLTENDCPVDNVFFHLIKSNENWCRDHGPAFVVKDLDGGKREKAIVDWGFNAWGGKYPPFDDDDAVPTEIGRELGLKVFDPGIVMEGGAIDVNGAGTLLTTTSCLLNKNRNPHLTREQIETYLLEYYGQEQVLWLGEGITGDDTDGHVDDLARFVSGNTIVTAVEDDPKDENYDVLRDNLKRLESMTDAKGRPFRIVKLPMPGVVEIEGERLPATYVNFYFVNGALLVPTYGHARNDEKALTALQELMPERQVIGLHCRNLIWGLGAIHCMTQQQPA